MNTMNSFCLQVRDIDLTRWHVMREVERKLMEEIRFIQFITYAGDSALFVTKDDKAYGVGWNKQCMLARAHSDVSDRTNTPLEIPELSGKQIIGFACGSEHCLGLTMGGEVYGWGNNRDGQLGRGTRKDIGEPLPIKIEDLTNVISICCGDTFSMALNSKGEVYVWGYNVYRQCALDEFDYVLKPSKITFPAEVFITQISAGMVHAAALTKKGEVYCWGSNKFRQIGHSKFGELQSTPVKLELGSGEFFRKIICGRDHTLGVVKGSGKLYTWGLGSWNEQSSVRLITGLPKVLEVHTSFTSFSSVADTRDGVYVWVTFDIAGVEDTPEKPKKVENLDKGIHYFKNNFINCIEVISLAPPEQPKIEESEEEIPLEPFPEDLKMKIYIDGQVVHETPLNSMLSFFKDDHTLKPSNFVLSESQQPLVDLVKYVNENSVPFADAVTLIEEVKNGIRETYDELMLDVLKKCPEILYNDTAVMWYGICSRLGAELELQNVVEYILSEFQDIAKGETFEHINDETFKSIITLWAQ